METLKLIFIILSAVLIVAAVIFTGLAVLNGINYLYYDDAAFMEKAFFDIRMIIFSLMGGFISWVFAKILDIFCDD